jgi:hypothetical protein
VIAPGELPLYTLYVAPAVVLADHARLIWVDDTAVACNPPGAAVTGADCVVALAVLLVPELPPDDTATTSKKYDVDGFRLVAW